MKDSERRKKESVWDYPRPPRVEPSTQLIRVVFNGTTVAETRSALRVLETSHPPVYYVPPSDVRQQLLSPTAHRSYCEYKGRASYYSLKVGNKVSENAAWSYHQPSAGYESIKDHLAFYPARVDACYVDGERVQAQDGDFYGGWITSNIEGPFKGGPGTAAW